MNILDKFNDVDMLKIDGKELSIKGRFELVELYQAAGQIAWNESAKASRAINLADNTWIFRIPEKERGQYVWFRAQVREGASTLGDFFKGGDEPDSWGPARKFARSGQKEGISYEMWGKTWQICDIGAFRVEGDSNAVMEDGDRLYFVTSRSEGEWMLYLDARHGEAKGSGGVFIGKAFDPDVDIQFSL